MMAHSDNKIVSLSPICGLLRLWVSILSLLVIPIVLVVPAASFADSSCTDLFPLGGIGSLASEAVSIYGRTLSVYRVADRQLKSGKFFPTATLHPEKAVFIGFDMFGHTYIVANGIRYDGNFLPRAPKLKKSTGLSRGIVIRIADPDGVVTATIAKYSSENYAPRSIDCVEGVCKVLAGSANWQIAETRLQALYPSSFLEQVIKNGFHNAGGEPLETQFILIGDKKLPRLMTEMQISSVLLTAGTGAFLVGIPYVIYLATMALGH